MNVLSIIGNYMYSKPFDINNTTKEDWPRTLLLAYSKHFLLLIVGIQGYYGLSCSITTKLGA